MAAKKKDTTIDILKISTGRISFCVLGRTPIILNRLSQKARRELLMPKGRKTAADKAANLKHIPIDEFRASPYLNKNPDADTYITHLSSAFKKSMSGAALDLPGASKAQIGRLLWVEGERVSIYGIPQLFMSPVRSADMNKTPDIRTRAIIPEWAAIITVSFQKPMLKEQGVSNLLACAGITQGIGDWRNEKGSGTYGGFDLVSDDNEKFKHILENGGREAQMAAMQDPDFYDDETEELFLWFVDEAKVRGHELPDHNEVDDSSPESYGVEGNGASA